MASCGPFSADGASELSGRRYLPGQVMPTELAAAVDHLPYWFPIGEQAVRCSSPYRPSRYVDFGVGASGDLEDLLANLARTGSSEVDDRSADTVHLRWNGIAASVFVLPFLLPFVEDRSLSTTGILATKLHAIVDRGTRRDFFDLYVMLQHHHLGILECFTALRRVYVQDVNDGLLLATRTDRPSRAVHSCAATRRESRATSHLGLRRCPAT